MAENANVKGYAKGNVPSALGNPNYNEAWALIEVARRIAAIVRFGDLTQVADKLKLRAELRLNLRIWTIIQAEQTAGDNLLPDALRMNILTLCKFIDKHTIDTMIEPTQEKAVVLININRNIAAGLLGSVSDDELSVEPEAPESEEEPTKSDENSGVGIKV